MRGLVVLAATLAMVLVAALLPAGSVWLSPQKPSPG
jgi:hypothetical protein